MSCTALKLGAFQWVSAQRSHAGIRRTAWPWRPRSFPALLAVRSKKPQAEALGAKCNPPAGHQTVAHSKHFHRKALLSPAGVIALERQFDLIFHTKARHSL